MVEWHSLSGSQSGHVVMGNSHRYVQYKKVLENGGGIEAQPFDHLFDH